MNRLIQPLTELAEYDELRQRMRKTEGILELTGCMEAQKAHMIYGLSYDVPVTVVVAENDLSAKVLYENLRFYDPDALYYPAKDLLFYQADMASNVLDQQRVEVYRAILERKENHLTIVLPVAALMDFVTQRTFLKASLVEFRWGEESDFEDIKKALVILGYERCAEVELPGQFAFRGDILDVWGLTEDHPARIEFFGDEVDSMRYFDAETQRSIEEIQDLKIYPANDHTGSSAPFLTWFSIADTQFFLDEPNRLMESAQATEAEFRESIARRAELAEGSKKSGQDEALKDIPNIIGADQLQASLNRLHCISLSMLVPRRGGWNVVDSFSVTVQSVSSYNKSYEFLERDLRSYRERGYRVIVLSASHTRAKRLVSELNDSEIPAFYSEDMETPLKAGQIAVQYGHASRGFEYPMIRFAVISETDILGEQKTRRRRRKKSTEHPGQRIAGLNDLSVGDYVVHENYGLGIYRGIEQIEVDGTVKDYIKIEYNGSNLFILATQLDLLQKYAGADTGSGKSKPKLNKLGTQEWEKTKSRVKGSVRNIAKDLVKLYAARQKDQGFVYSPDTEWQKEFEEMFPFEETDDQMQAIEDTKHDMESPKIMDRLICGDVGYGKTEIALRAAFKAVQDGKQVAYLVPTTILAQQHFNTFSQRMKDFPVRVDMLSRFRSPSQQKKMIQDLKKGFVDIVIGTHRLLSKDVEFKDLGLLIIDEEQRFGVSAKEKIKKLRETVDVLTLTATPIPRTLHMSLIGIRDMSILEEPPQDRTPIQTYVMEFNPEMVREAICRELARNGQVYYVYNRVRDIADMAKRVQAMVPEANVAYADGKMPKDDLEDIMVSFVNGEIDVLVTTTIIETGLDIQNANTIIIHDADRFGLSQLYQLRGRVGRSNRTSYAFLMYQKDKMLKEVAEKRLSAIKEFTALGSGFKIAMRDLEIRGAGNLLGAEQSGHMEAVGYDLYCKMLSEAVQEAKGIEVEEDFETVVDIPIDAYIPDKYIPNEFQKLDFYKKIAAIENEDDYSDIQDELLDRYGDLPRTVRNLMQVALMKAAAHRAGITEIKAVGNGVRIAVGEHPKFDPASLPKIIGSHAGKFTVHAGKTDTHFMYHGDLQNKKEMMKELKTFLTELDASSGKQTT
jgi:transcription-repair coupling factor (superfamily II helicase)